MQNFQTFYRTTKTFPPEAIYFNNCTSHLFCPLYYSGKIGRHFNIFNRPGVVINRPGVAGAVLQTASLLIN